MLTSEYFESVVVPERPTLLGFVGLLGVSRQTSTASFIAGGINTIVPYNRLELAIKAEFLGECSIYVAEDSGELEVQMSFSIKLVKQVSNRLVLTREVQKRLFGVLEQMDSAFTIVAR